MQLLVAGFFGLHYAEDLTELLQWTGLPVKQKQYKTTQHTTSDLPFPLPKTTNSWGLTSSERNLTVYAVGTPTHASEVVSSP